MSTDVTTENRTTEREDHEHEPNYLLVFGILCCLTVLSVVADALKQENIAMIIALVAFTVALIKASYVMMYFMHLKFEGNWKYVILIPTILLGFGLPLAMLPDMGIHYYTIDESRVPPTSIHEVSEEHKAPVKTKEDPFLEKPKLGPAQKTPPSPG